MIHDHTPSGAKLEARFARALSVRVVCLVLVALAAACCTSDKEARQEPSEAAMAHLEDARDELEANRLEEAGELLERAEEAGLPSRETQELGARIERRRAEEAADDDRHEEAFESYRKAYELEPAREKRFEDLMAALEIGEDLRRPPEELATLATRATELKTSSHRAQQKAARLWDEAARPANALPHYQWLHKVDDEDVSVALRLGNILLSEGKLSQAQEVFEQIRSLEPDHAIAGLKLADTYARRDEHASAERLYEELVEAHPQRAGVLMRFANYLDERGDTERADQMRQRARQAQPATEKREMRELR